MSFFKRLRLKKNKRNLAAAANLNAVAAKTNGTAERTGRMAGQHNQNLQNINCTKANCQNLSDHYVEAQSISGQALSGHGINGQSINYQASNSQGTNAQAMNDKNSRELGIEHQSLPHQALPHQNLPPQSLLSAQKIQRQQLCHDLKQMLSSGEGQRYLARLITLSGAFGPSYSAAGAEASAYNEGLRRMGLFILAEVQEYAPELLPRLLILCLPATAPVQ